MSETLRRIWKTFRPFGGRPSSWCVISGYNTVKHTYATIYECAWASSPLFTISCFRCVSVLFLVDHACVSFARISDNDNEWLRRRRRLSASRERQGGKRKHGNGYYVLDETRFSSLGPYETRRRHSWCCHSLSREFCDGCRNDDAVAEENNVTIALIAN